MIKYNIYGKNINRTEVVKVNTWDFQYMYNYEINIEGIKKFHHRVKNFDIRGCSPCCTDYNYEVTGIRFLKSISSESDLVVGDNIKHDCKNHKIESITMLDNGEKEVVIDYYASVEIKTDEELMQAYKDYVDDFGLYQLGDSIRIDIERKLDMEQEVEYEQNKKSCDSIISRIKRIFEK